MKINKMELGLVMASKGLNFKQLSKVSGISRTTLSAINNGKACKPNILWKIAKALDIQPESLLEARP